MSKFWLVEVEGVNGVRSVTDMGAMSLRTLEDIVGSVLLPVDQVLLPRRAGK